MKVLVMASMALVLFAPLAPAQHSAPQSGEVAHGAEKATQKQVHPNEQHGDDTSHAPKTYFGIPGWILKLANMLLFFGVLGWVIGGPAKRGFAARGAAIRQAAEEARNRRQKADQVASDIQARLTQIEQEVRSIRERARSEGERQKRDLIAAAEAESAKILQAARAEVENRLKLARKELTEYAGELAAERAEALLRERITDTDQRNLFAQSVRELREVGK